MPPSGLGLRGPRSHRPCFLIRERRPITDVTAYLGHASVATTTRFSLQPDDDRKRASADAIERVLGDPARSTPRTGHNEMGHDGVGSPT
jgi:hypothetical protein